MSHYQLITLRKKTFAQAHIIHRIQNIGLAHAIGTYKHIESGMKTDALRLIISELGQFKCLQTQYLYMLDLP